MEGMLLLKLLCALGRLAAMCDDDIDMSPSAAAAADALDTAGVVAVARIVLSGVSGEHVGVELAVATDEDDDASFSFLLH
jgi:hypothetical protein